MSRFWLLKFCCSVGKADISSKIAEEANKVVASQKADWSAANTSNCSANSAGQLYIVAKVHAVHLVVIDTLFCRIPVISSELEATLNKRNLHIATEWRIHVDSGTETDARPIC